MERKGKGEEARWGGRSLIFRGSRLKLPGGKERIQRRKKKEKKIHRERAKKTLSSGDQARPERAPLVPHLLCADYYPGVAGPIGNCSSPRQPVATLFTCTNKVQRTLLRPIKF